MNIDLKKDDDTDDEVVFGEAEEKAIISLAFDQPDFFSTIISLLKPEYFDKYETRFVFALIKHSFDKNGVILSRPMCKDIAVRYLTSDDPHQEILELIFRESDPRDVPVIIDRLTEWARKKTILQLYDKDVMDSVEGGDIQRVNEILEEANKITTSGFKCHFFFDEVDRYFETIKVEKMTSGFPKLDMALNEGGPERGEVLCFMAPTGKGKSLTMVNSGVANVKRGYVVLHVTLEMTWLKTAIRYVGCFTDVWISQREANEDKIRKILRNVKETHNGQLILVEFPPDEISVDTIHNIIDMLRRSKGIKVDVVIIDYLELLLSRNPHYNKDDYIRQKRVCTESDRLAKKESALVITATQTNRGGVKNEGEAIGIDKVAESYGKIMPISYLITINQSQEDYENGRTKSGAVIRARTGLYIAKNRNGPQFKMVEVKTNYETMKMMEET
jgi:replicative DNA helicase